MDFPLVLSTVGLVTTIYIEVVASNALHLYSECLCWATLTVLLAAAYYCARQGERTQSKEGEAEESSTSFVIAGAILVSCLCRQHGAVTSLMVSRSPLGPAKSLLKDEIASGGSCPGHWTTSCGPLSYVGAADGHLVGPLVPQDPAGGVLGHVDLVPIVPDSPSEPARVNPGDRGVDYFQWRLSS